MDFACKELDAEQVLKCSLGLTKAGCAILHYLRRREEWLTSEEVSEGTGYDLATTQRALKHLHSRGALGRRQHNREIGGYEYLYHALREEAFRRLVYGILDGWQDRAKKEVASWLREKKR